MKTYTAHISAGTMPVVVPEGWCWSAALFGPLWFLAHRLWLPAALYVLLAVLGARFLPAPFDAALGWALVLASGLFGRDLWRAALAARDYQLAHVVAATSDDLAFARLMQQRPDLVADMAPGFARDVPLR